MQTLPWLFGHGPLVWQAGIAALVIGALVLAFLRPRRAAQKAAAAARARIGEPTPMPAKPSEGMRVTLAGTIAIEGSPCARFEDGEGAAAATVAYAPQGARGAWVSGLNVRAERIVLQVGEASIALEGQVEVSAGAVEDHRGKALGRLSRAAQDRVAQGFKLGPPHFRDRVVVLRSVGAGDRVRVSGVLKRDAHAGEAAGYRAAAERWSLVPDGDAAQAAAGFGAPAGLVLACEEAPRVRGPGAPWYVMHAAGGAIAAAALFGLGGEIAFASAESALVEIGTGKAGKADAGMSAAALAAATPFRRAQAITALADALDLRHDEDAALIERRAALHQLAGDCASAARALVRQGAILRGAEMASRCEEHRIAAEAFYVLGDFTRASEAWEQVPPDSFELKRKEGGLILSDAELRFAMRVNLLAGKRAVAARLARARGEAAAAGPDASRMAMLRCLALAIEGGGGDNSARARLRGERELLKLPACAVLLADLYPADRSRLEVIHSLTDFQSSAREVPMRWLELLEQEADPSTTPNSPAPPVIDRPALAVINPSLAVVPMLPALERSIAERRPEVIAEPLAARLRATMLAASFAAATGDYHAARKLVKMAAADIPRPKAAHAGGDHADEDGLLPDPDALPTARIAALAAAIELAAGDLSRTAELITEANRTGNVVELEAIHRYRSERDPDRLASFYSAWSIIQEGTDTALVAAAKGDGAALAAWLRKPSSEIGPTLRLGAPLALTGREDLLQWVRTGYRLPGWFRSPADLAVHWMDLASAAAALGDTQLSNELSERAGRFRAAMLRRDIAVPLAVIERF